jgi:uncharacterized protein (DUF1697 family)
MDCGDGVTTWVALLRAVNVGGTTKLPMEQLRAICVEAGFSNVRTYIASGNVLLESGQEEAAVRGSIESAIERTYGKRIPVVIRAGAELARVLSDNPFPEAAGSRLMVLFTDEPPSIEGLRHQAGEELALGRREIFIHYGEGMGQSKLVIPAAKNGTARNLNTVRKLAEMAGAI